MGANHYIRPDEAFWSTMLDNPKQARAYTAFAAHRWIKVGKDDDLLTTAGLDGADAFAERNALEAAVPQQLSLGERKDIGGVPTITILDSRNSTASGTKISVATTGEPYPIRWDFGLGAIADFSDFGTTTDPIGQPPPAEVVDLTAVLRSS